jgi:hypothetical protein
MGDETKKMKFAQTVMLPGWDEKNGVTNSCLYKAFHETMPESVVVYDLTEAADGGCLDEDKVEPLIKLNKITDDTEMIIVHSAGLTYLGVIASVYQQNCEKLKTILVLDGWLSKCIQQEFSDMTSVFPDDVKVVFVTPTDGDREPYKVTKELMIDPMLRDRKDVFHVNVVGLRHNFIYDGFTKDDFVKMVEALLDFAAKTPEREAFKDYVVEKPWNEVTARDQELPSCAQKQDEDDEEETK